MLQEFKEGDEARAEKMSPWLFRDLKMSGRFGMACVGSSKGPRTNTTMLAPSGNLPGHKESCTATSVPG